MTAGYSGTPLAKKLGINEGMTVVAVDAFSQALTNPLLSEHVFKPDTFSKLGWDTIQHTGSLRDVLERNSPKDIGDARISMTLSSWKHTW